MVDRARIGIEGSCYVAARSSSVKTAFNFREIHISHRDRLGRPVYLSHAAKLLPADSAGTHASRLAPRAPAAFPPAGVPEVPSLDLSGKMTVCRAAPVHESGCNVNPLANRLS